MPIIKSKTKDGAESTLVVSAQDKHDAIGRMRKDGNTDMRDVETGEKYYTKEVFPAVNVMREDVEHFIGDKATSLTDDEMQDIASTLGDFLAEEYHPCLEATLEKLNYINHE